MTTPLRAIVTGAANGIGRAVADQLRHRGDVVVGLDRETGDDIIAVDLAAATERARAIAEAIATLGGADILVNVAGHLPVRIDPRLRARGLARRLGREPRCAARPHASRRADDGRAGIRPDRQRVERPRAPGAARMPRLRRREGGPRGGDPVRRPRSGDARRARQRRRSGIRAHPHEPARRRSRRDRHRGVPRDVHRRRQAAARTRRPCRTRSPGPWVTSPAATTRTRQARC